MSQHDMDVANAPRVAVRADINQALVALATNNSGATAPATTFAYQWWADTTAGILKQRNAANSAWISILTLATGMPLGVASSAQADALLDIPPTAVSASYTLILGDRGKSIDFTGAAAQTITIPANASVAFPVGSVVTITNNSANSLAIAITSDTLRQAGTLNVAGRTLAAYGVATARKVSSTVWIIGGSGLT